MKIPQKYVWLAWISVPVLVLDQITKYFIQLHYQVGQSTAVIPQFFSITYVRNRGAAFGFMAAAPDGIREVFLTVVPLVALGLVVYYYRSVQPGQKYMPLALSLIVGGAVGNLIDRFRFSYVVDFLDFFVGRYHWPAFNVADSAICVGVGMMAYHMMFLEPKENVSKAVHDR
jgi:signal peptidase II